MPVNLLEVAPSTRTVQTHKFGELEVPGIGLSGLAYLIRNNPELYDIFQKAQTEGDELDISVNELFDIGEPFVIDFIAAGLGYVNSEEANRQVAAMPPGDAWDVAEAVISESFPGGLTDFLGKIQRAADKANSLAAEKDPLNQSPASQSS